CAVTRYENAVIADVQRLQIKRGVEPFPEISACDIQVCVSSEVRRNVAPLSGREIDLDQPVALSGAIAHTVHSCGLERIRYDGSELGRWQRIPIDRRDLTLIAATARHDRARVLLRPHHPIRIPGIGCDVVDLRDRY